MKKSIFRCVWPYGEDAAGTNPIRTEDPNVVTIVLESPLLSAQYKFRWRIFAINYFSKVAGIKKYFFLGKDINVNRLKYNYFVLIPDLRLEQSKSTIFEYL